MDNLLQKKTSADKWHSFYRVRCPSCHPTNSVKALKEIQNHLVAASILQQPPGCKLEHDI